MTNIPFQLKESIKNGTIIPFVGAGVSMAVKNKTDGTPLFPSWKVLLERAATRLEKEGKNDEASIVNLFVKKDRLLDAAKEAKQALAANWFNFLKQQFDHCKDDATDASLALAQSIWQLGSQLVITTNYDHVLRWACPQNHDLAGWDIEAPAEQCDLLRNGVRKPTIWHLHGQIDNAAEIILTPDGYSKLYSDNKSEQKYRAALQTLQHQLSGRTFIFIGFSLTDEDFVGQITLLEEIFQGAAGPHYVLLPESQRVTFKPPIPCIEPIYFQDFGTPQLELLKQLASIASSSKPNATTPRTDEVGDYSPDKPVFFVPFPSKGEQMIGRQETLNQVRQQLCSGRRTAIGQTVSFQGLGGLGKTQLAVEYAHCYRHEYPNGVIWINADQEIPVQLIQLAEKASWVSPLAEQAFKLSTAIKRLREVPDCLIIFDNVENQQDIAEILPNAKLGSHILVTSRFEQPGFTPIPLDTLLPEQGLQLLLQEAGRNPTDADENQAAADIVQQLDGLPLALELAGAFLRRRDSISWRQYLELLQDNLQDAFPSYLQQDSFTRHEADIYSTLKIHATLFDTEPLLQEILDVLTWSGSAKMSVSILCAMLAKDKASSLIGALSLGCALRILQQSSDGKAYGLHRLVREVRRAEILLTKKTVWAETCAQRLGDWFEQHRQDFRDLPLFEADMDHLQAWRQNTQMLHLPLLAARLTWLQAYPAWHWGRYHEAQQYLEQAQTLYIQAPKQDVALKTHLLNDLATITNNLGDTKIALKLSEEALSLRCGLFGEEHPDTAQSLSNIANYYDSLGNTQHALELGEKALQIRRKLFGEEHPDTAASLNNIADYYNSLGNTSHALELAEQALQIRRKLLGEEHPNTAQSLNNVASIYDSLGNAQHALDLGEKALQIRRKLFGEEHPDTAISLNNFAGYYNSLGNTSHALKLGEQALRINRKLFDEEHPNTATSLNNIAFYCHCLGSLKGAIEFGEQAWAIRQKLLGNDHPDTVSSNYNLISYLRDNNQRPEAYERLQRQLTVIKKDHPHYDKLIRLRDQLLSKPIRNGFRQPSKHSGKNKPKKHR